MAEDAFWLPLVAAVLVGGAAVGIDVASEPGTPYRQVVEERLVAEFRDQYRAGMVVHCPDEPRRKGQEFLCDAEIETGEKGQLRVHVTSDDGAFTWSVVEQSGPATEPGEDRLAERTLRAGQLAEEDYFSEHHRYTKDVTELTAFTVPPGVEFRIVRADDKAFCLEARSAGSEHPYTLSNDGGQPVRDGAC